MDKRNLRIFMCACSTVQFGTALWLITIMQYKGAVTPLDFRYWPSETEEYHENPQQI